MFQLKCLETAWIDHHLFVVCDSATLIANARLESLFWNRLCRTGLRKLVINRDEASLRRALKGFVYSFSYRVILERQGTDIYVQKRRTFIRRNFPVRHVVAKHVEIALVKLLVIWIIEFTKCRSFIGFERTNGEVEHCSRLFHSAELLAANRRKAKGEKWC